jgi:hypothetical protein
MSHHHYNFTAGTSHADNNMLAVIVLRFETPPVNLFEYVHGPNQVGDSLGFIGESLLMNCH